VFNASVLFSNYKRLLSIKNCHRCFSTRLWRERLLRVIF